MFVFPPVVIKGTATIILMCFSVGSGCYMISWTGCWLQCRTVEAAFYHWYFVCWFVLSDLLVSILDMLQRQKFKKKAQFEMFETWIVINVSNTICKRCIGVYEEEPKHLRWQGENSCQIIKQVRNQSMVLSFLRTEFTHFLRNIFDLTPSPNSLLYLSKVLLMHAKFHQWHRVAEKSVVHLPPPPHKKCFPETDSLMRCCLLLVLCKLCIKNFSVFISCDKLFVWMM